MAIVVKIPVFVPQPILHCLCWSMYCISSIVLMTLYDAAVAVHLHTVR